MLCHFALVAHRASWTLAKSSVSNYSGESVEVVQIVNTKKTSDIARPLLDSKLHTYSAVYMPIV